MAERDRPTTPPRRPLRHPAEVPYFVFMVVLNVVIVIAIIRAAVVVPFLPEQLQSSAFANTVRAALIGLLLFLPGLIVVRETQRAAVRGSTVQLSEAQFPSLYRTAEDFASRLGLRRRPDIFLTNGNGALNAFAAQATGGPTDVSVGSFHDRPGSGGQRPPRVRAAMAISASGLW